MSTRVSEGNGALEAERWLPDERQVDAFEVREADVLASEALHVLDAVDDYGPTEDVGQGEYVRLLERCAWLVRQRDYVAPVLLELVVVDVVVERACHQDLVLLPAWFQVTCELLQCVRHHSTQDVVCVEYAVAGL